MPSENTVRQHQAHNIQEPLHLSSTSLQSEWVSTNNATIGVTRHRDAIVIQDDTSDTESTESFHTAPSSPMHIAPNNDRDDSEQTTSMDELLREEEKWKRALEYKSRQIEAIAWAMGAKRAELKELKLKEMEYRTRKQFLRNHWMQQRICLQRVIYWICYRIW